MSWRCKVRQKETKVRRCRWSPEERVTHKAELNDSDAAADRHLSS